MKYLIPFILIIMAVGGYFINQSTQNVSVGADLRTFISTQLAGSPIAGYVLSTDGSVNSWIPASGGGSSKWTDEGTVIYPTTLESIRVPFIEASSTSATSTLPNLKSNNIMAISSAGLVVRAANNTSVADFGVGNTANSLFLGGVNIDGATRLATSINGVLQATAGAVTATTTGTLTETVTGLQFDATRALIGGNAVLSLTSGYSVPLTASTTEWTAAYASTTALTPTYIRGLFSNTATGLTYTAASGLTALTAGYNIPLTASTSNWNGFYDVPSTRITAGNGLAWSENTLSATSTHAAVTLSGAFDYITLVGQDIVRGAIDLATDITGTLSIGNGGTGATTLNDLITLGTHTTGNYVATVAGTSNEIAVSGSGSETAAVILSLPSTVDLNSKTVKQHTYKSFTWPGTATTTAATTTLPLGTAFTAEAWNSAECWVTSGTGAVIFTDGTNRMNGFTATTTAARTTLSTNNTFTASERRYVEIGPLTAAQLSCTLDVTVNN